MGYSFFDLFELIMSPTPSIGQNFGEDFDFHLCSVRLNFFYFYFLNVNLAFSMFSKTCIALLMNLTRHRLVTPCNGPDLHLRLFLDFMSLIILVKLLVLRVEVWNL